MKISVIIPSNDGFREGNIEQLKKQLREQTLTPDEVIIVIGVSPNGKARNVGVEKACGEYYVFIDDDVSLGDRTVIEKLIKPFFERNDIGMTGPSQQIPPDSNSFQKKAAMEIPRSLFPIQTELVDSDMVSHMCLAIPARLFKEVGWENPDIISGTDPDLRERVRKAGFRICVVPDCWAYHPMPKNWKELITLAFLKGKNSARTQITHPDLVYELDGGYRKKFQPKRSFLFRIYRSFIDLIISILNLKLIYTTYRISYLLGYIYERFCFPK